MSREQGFFQPNSQSPKPLYDYGTIAVNASASHIFTVSNIGGGPATVVTEVGLAAPYQFVGGAFPGTGGTCGSTIAPAASCDLVI